MDRIKYNSDDNLPAKEKSFTDTDRNINVEAVFNWNWAAFLLSIIWCFAMRLWLWFGLIIIINLTLIIFFPVNNIIILINFFICLYLGIYGNKLAYNSRWWQDNKHFNDAQLFWDRIGKNVGVLFLVFIFLAGLYHTFDFIYSISKPTVVLNWFSGPSTKQAYLFEKLSKLDIAINHYILFNENKIPLDLKTELIDTNQFIPFKNPYSNQIAFQVPYGEWSPGNFSYLVIDEAYTNNGRIKEELAISLDSGLYLLVVYSNNKNDKFNLKGYNSKGILTSNFKAIQGNATFVLIDTISKEKVKVHRISNSMVEIEKYP